MIHAFYQRLLAPRKASSWPATACAGKLLIRLHITALLRHTARRLPAEVVWMNAQAVDVAGFGGDAPVA